ncbi:MAG: type II toxin-antitoxin system PemK/MazF family toxin [bacterium]|nr:type II toxin-antitoxin system PemK/MazF family toxin [bacterium]
MTSVVPGDIVLVDLGTIPSGREQAGIRPGIFLYGEGGVSLIIPLSSNTARLRFNATLRILPDATNKLTKPSVALVFQLRALDSRRLLKCIGTLGAKDRRALNSLMRTVTLIK